VGRHSALRWRRGSGIVASGGVMVASIWRNGGVMVVTAASWWRRGASQCVTVASWWRHSAS
jgi:hypothetical protein